VRSEPACVLSLEGASKAPAPSSLDLLAGPARHARRRRFLRARSRVSEGGALFLFQSSRPAMRPIDFCTPKPFPTRAPVTFRRFPAQRSMRFMASRSRSALSGARRSRIAHFRSLSAPCPPARTSLFAQPASPSEDAAEPGTGKLGPPGADETGEIRASRRVSHFGDRLDDTSRWRFLPPSASNEPFASDAPVASSVTQGADAFGESALCHEGGQDRFRARPVKSERIADPERLPSESRMRASRPRSVARGRNRVTFNRSHGAHVMRIAALRVNRPPFAADSPLRLRAGEIRWSGSRSRAPVGMQAFDLGRYG